MSWLKFDTATPEKPEVFAITIALGWEDPDLTVGKLLKVWRWFDLHSVDGNAKGVTLALLDRLIGVTGLSQAMIDVGWLEISEDGLTLPNFEAHNGKTAKDRALTAKRAAGHRINTSGNDKSNASSVTNALPREEKRREEKKKINTENTAQAPSAYADLLSEVPKQVVDDWEKLRKAKKATVTRTAIESIVREAGKAGLTLEQALTECCARGWIGFKADWFADKKPIDQRHDPPKKSFYERDLELKTARIAELTGRAKPSEKTVIDITPRSANEFAVTMG